MFDCYDDFKTFVSQSVYKLREQNNISARDLSLSLGLNDGYINRIENKKSMPSMENFFNICQYFNIAPKDFFDDGQQAPGQLAALIAECKNLDAQSLQLLLEMAKKMKS